MTTATQDADLESIESAVFSSLLALRDDAGGPFVSVERFAGENTSQDAQLATAAALSGTPSILLAWAKEDFVEEQGGDTLVEHDRVFIGTSFWRVFVTHTEFAGFDEAVEGQGGTSGILGLVSLVEKRLSGLPIPGLYLDAGLVPVTAAPARMKVGQYISVITFKARRVLIATDLPDDFVPFTGLQGEIDLDGISDPDDGLVVPFKATP